MHPGHVVPLAHRIVLHLLNGERQTARGTVHAARFGRIRRASCIREGEIVPQDVAEVLPFHEELIGPLLLEVLPDLRLRPASILRYARGRVQHVNGVGRALQIAGLQLVLGDDQLRLCITGDRDGAGERRVLVLRPDRGETIRSA